jgi:D-threo-aldose 1-dehydrogenase
MKQITIPDTELKVSRLGFGTASLHHLISEAKRKDLLNFALDLGFTHFDTAPLYGEGLTEKTLGNCLRSRRDKITLATKIGIFPNPLLRNFPALMYGQKFFDSATRRFIGKKPSLSKRSLDQNLVENSLRSSLQALQTDWLDILFIHEPQVTDIPSLLALAEWLQKQKQDGVVRYLGLAGQSHHCVEIMQNIPNLFDILQVEDSIKGQESDLIISAGYPQQITYGYLRKSSETNTSIDGKEVIKKALIRNTQGMILVSSRNFERLKVLSSPA